MSTSSPPSCSQQPISPQPRPGPNWLARTALTVVRTVREMNYAQQRLHGARMSYEAYLPAPNQAPDTYQEFLLRTSFLVRHEPAAAQRAAGRRVR